MNVPWSWTCEQEGNRTRRPGRIAAAQLAKDRGNLHAGGHDPNHVAWPELELLKVYLLEGGWTQSIVARPDGQIVDGFRRWTCSADPRLYAMTDGFRVVVHLPPATGDQLLSTVRHDRARGEHGVLPRADIVRTLVDERGLTQKQVIVRCDMKKGEECAWMTRAA